MGNVTVTTAGSPGQARGAPGRVKVGKMAARKFRVPSGDTSDGETRMSGGIGSVRRDVGDDRIGPGDIPSQRTAADAYRVSDDQLHRARMVVARNSADQEDLRQLLDMLGLISANPDQPPPVTR